MPEEKETLTLTLVPESRQKHFEKLMKKVRRTIFLNHPTEGEYLNMALCLLKTSAAAQKMPAKMIGALVTSILESEKEGEEND